MDRARWRNMASVQRLHEDATKHFVAKRGGTLALYKCCALWFTLSLHSKERPHVFMMHACTHHKLVVDRGDNRYKIHGPTWAVPCVRWSAHHCVSPYRCDPKVCEVFSFEASKATCELSLSSLNKERMTAVQKHCFCLQQEAPRNWNQLNKFTLD